MVSEAYVKTDKITGADFGLKNFLTLSSGEKIHSPQPLKKSLRQLADAQKKFSRKVKGSNSRRNAGLIVARIHRHIDNQRKHFHWQTAVDLAKRFDALGFEELNLLGMKALWGRKVSDLGFAGFVSIQKWICEKRGKFFGQTDRWNPTTKTMSCCGHIQNVALDEREVTCQNCGTTYDRDVNAAINIEQACRRLWLGAEC